MSEELQQTYQEAEDLINSLDDFLPVQGPDPVAHTHLNLEALDGVNINHLHDHPNLGLLNWITEDKFHIHPNFELLNGITADTFAPAVHTHSVDQIAGLGSAALADSASFSPTIHFHNLSALEGTVALTQLATKGGTPGQSIRLSSGGWEYYTPTLTKNPITTSLSVGNVQGNQGVEYNASNLGIFALLAIEASSSVRIRFYNSALKRNSDRLRPIGNLPISQNNNHGLLCEVVLNAISSLKLNLAPSPAIYPESAFTIIQVDNLEIGIQNIIINLTYLSLN
jgi:hypothetical protein